MRSPDCLDFSCGMFLRALLIRKPSCGLAPPKVLGSDNTEHIELILH
jgi:hypothetical protein